MPPTDFDSDQVALRVSRREDGGRSRRFEWRFRGNAARDSLAIRGLGGQEIAKPLDGLFPADDALVHQHR
jgi:hypothetical protein